MFGVIVSANATTEELSIELARFVEERGYGVASSDGEASHPESFSGCVGLLKGERKYRKHLFGLLKTPVRRQFVGVVWFSNGLLDACIHTWVLEVHGTENVKEMYELSIVLSNEFNIDIQTKLGHKEPQVEALWRDATLNPTW